MSFECEYCKKSYSSKGILKSHQNTAKFCLEIRKKIENDKNEVKLEKFQCEFCFKILSSKYRLQQHLDNCKVKYDNIINKSQDEIETKFNEMKTFYENEIKKLENKNKLLQDQIKELAKIAIEKPNPINYNTNNQIKNIDNRIVNMIPYNITPQFLRETIESKFNETYLMKGQKGVAEFMLENVLITEEDTGQKKYLMKCTDPSRKIFITMDKKGKVIKDVNAENLTKIISEPVKEQCHRIYKELHDRFYQVYESVGNELKDEDEEKKNLDVETDRFEHATNKVVEISRLKNDNNEFVKGLIAPLTL